MIAALLPAGYLLYSLVGRRSRPMLAATLGLAAGLAPKALPVLAIFLASEMQHLVLDTIGGGIAWLWLFNETLYALVEVPATQSHFILPFIFHWTFLAELALTAAAGVLIFTRKQHDP